MRSLIPIVLTFLLLLMPGRATAQETPSEKARAAQFLTPERLAHATQVAWKAARDHARTFPNMPVAFDGPVVINVQSFEGEVQRATSKTLDQKAFMKRLRPKMSGKRVRANNPSSKKSDRIYISFPGYSGVERTQNGYKIQINLQYDNSVNMKGSSYDQRYPIVRLYYEQRNGKWRIVDKKMGQLVP